MLNQLSDIKDILAFYVVIPLVIAAGGYLSVRLGFLQITKLPQALRLLFKATKAKSSKKVSSLQALAAVVGGNLGTGNIAGIAIGLKVGGPGALFWMWLVAVVSAIVKFVGCYLAVMYQTKDAKNEGGFTGGPMYYLAQGLNHPWLAKVFCVLCMLGALTVGNLVQVNSVALPLIDAGFDRLFVGLAMAVCVALVVLAGKKIFLSLASRVVPLMAFLYLLACSAILIRFYDQLDDVFRMIFDGAFQGYAVAGGATFLVFDAIKEGFSRGVFATDSGIGLAPILHAEVESSKSKATNAFEQGLVAIVAPIIVMVICTITGLTILVTGSWQVDGLHSTSICVKAFELGLGTAWAGHLVTITLWFFAFTTLLTWAHCSEKAFHFLAPKTSSLPYKLFFIALIPFGAFGSVYVIWVLADLAIFAMLLLNLYAVVRLFPKVKDAIARQQKNWRP